MKIKQSVFQASVFIIIGSLSSRIFGFVREILIAQKFGAGTEYDVFLVSTAIPIILVNVFLYAMPGGIIPQYLELKMNSGEPSALCYFSKFFSFYTLFFVLFSMVLFIFAPLIIDWYFPTAQGSDFEKAVNIFRIGTGFIVFGGMFSIVKSVLTANKIFLLPAFTPVFLNISIITSLLLLTDRFGIYSLAIGFGVGYLLQFLAVVLQAQLNNIQFRFLPDFGDKLIKKSVPVLVVILVINFLGQFYTFIDRAFNAALPIGAISGLNYAMVLVQIIINLFGVALGTAMFPSISEFITLGKNDKLVKLLTNTLKFVLMLIIPLAFFIFQNARDIMTVFFKRGSFDDLAVMFSSESFQCYSFGIVAFVTYNVLVNVFYSLKKYKYLLISGISAIAVKLVLSYYWIDSLQYKGLALATSIAVMTNVVILYGVIHFKFFKLEHRDIFITVFKMILISGLIYIVVMMIGSIMQSWLVIASLSVKVLIWFAGYLGLIFLFRLGNPIKLLGRDVS